MSYRPEIEQWFDRIGGRDVFEAAVVQANPDKPGVRDSIRKAVSDGYLRSRWWEIAAAVGGKSNPPRKIWFNFDRAQRVGNGDDTVRPAA